MAFEGINFIRLFVLYNMFQMRNKSFKKLKILNNFKFDFSVMMCKNHAI